MNADALLQALAARHAPPAWAFFPEVRNATGFPGTVRTADALAMSLWPSHGLELHGFEIKVARGDWIRETKDPAKSEAIAQFCDRWWLVVPDAKIVGPGELPAGWGLLAPRGESLIVKVDAPKLDSLPPTRAFLASLFRRVAEEREGEVKKRVAAVAEARAVDLAKCKTGAAEWEAKRLREDVARFERMIAEFETASGVRIDPWRAGEIGAAVKVALEGEHAIRRTRGRLNTIRLEVQELARHLEEVAPPPAEAAS